jgi:hypothetical protein
MGNVSSSNEGLDTIGGTELLFGSTKTVIQLVFGSFAIVRNIFTASITSFGIPPTIANIAFGAILSIIIVIIIDELQPIIEKRTLQLKPV